MLCSGLEKVGIPRPGCGYRGSSGSAGLSHTRPPESGLLCPCLAEASRLAAGVSRTVGHMVLGL